MRKIKSYEYRIEKLAAHAKMNQNVKLNNIDIVD